MNELKGTDPKDYCSKCGYHWEAHEFAVPEPYCPENDQTAKEIMGSFKPFKKRLEEILSKRSKVISTPKPDSISELEKFKKILYKTKYSFRGRDDRSPTDNITDFLWEVEQAFELETKEKINVG